MDTRHAKHYRDSSLKDAIVDKLQMSSSVVSGWNVLVQSTNPAVSSSLFKRQIEIYTDIRCRSYVNVYNYLQKRIGNASQKGEKSLRKQLCH